MSTTTSLGKFLTYDEIDDLIYYARAGDLETLKETIESLSRAKSRSISEVVQAAVDTDEEGLGSGSCLLHYPAANGNLAVVEYLIAGAAAVTGANTVGGGDNNAEGKETLEKNPGRKREREAWSKFVNHQNVSGNTPLHWAGVNGHLDVVKALMKVGADPGIVNGAGKDAVFESDGSSKEGAAECAVEMLKIYEGLEKSNGVVAGEASTEQEHNEGGVEGMEEQEIRMTNADINGNGNGDVIAEGSTVTNNTQQPS